MRCAAVYLFTYVSRQYDGDAITCSSSPRTLWVNNSFRLQIVHSLFSDENSKVRLSSALQWSWMLTIFFPLIAYGSLPCLSAYWYVLSWIKSTISLTSHSSVCHMYDPNGSHSVENEKSVKSNRPFFSLSWLCQWSVYQGIAGQDLFTGCLLTLPDGYYLSWIVFLVSESKLFFISG